MTTYSFDNAWEKARQRLAVLEARHDPGTLRILEECGVTAGWHCLEIGGGGGSITKWLCERVGLSGHVLATDIDTRFLETLSYSNLQVERHDIATDDLPRDAFDLVHSRMVLEHIPQREQAFDRMLFALKPGGWLVCEDMNERSTRLVSPLDEAKATLHAKVQNAVFSATIARGRSPDYALRLGLIFNAKGLVDVQFEGRVGYFSRAAGSGASSPELTRLTVEQLQNDIVQGGLVTRDEIDAFFNLIDMPSYAAISPTVFAAWGRRPAG